MAKITLSIPEELNKVIKKYPNVGWEEIARKAIREHSKKLEVIEALTERSTLTEADVQEIDKAVKKSLRKRYGL
jgi:hypothetical protein